MSTDSPKRGRSRSRRTSSFAPNISSSGTYEQEEQDYWTDRELSLIENALKENGEMSRKDLGNELGCKYWGPMRYRRALKIGVEEGRFRKVGGDRYAPIT